MGLPSLAVRQVLCCSGPWGHYLHLSLQASLLQQGGGDKGYTAAAAAILPEPPLPASSDASLVTPQERSCLRGGDLPLKYHHQATLMRRGEGGGLQQDLV